MSGKGILKWGEGGNYIMSNLHRSQIPFMIKGLREGDFEMRGRAFRNGRKKINKKIEESVGQKKE